MNREEELRVNGETNREEIREQDIVDAGPNRDPLTGEPGAHPVGTGIGAAAAGAIGTAIGAAAGPVGAVVGAAVGSFVGGLVGKSAAEATNPTVEDDYWRSTYTSRPYAAQDRAYEDYQPAYRTGYEGYNRYSDNDRRYEDVEPELRREYESQSVNPRLGWDDARYATKDAWDRAERNALFANEDNYWRQNYTSSPYYDSQLTFNDYQPAYRTGYEGYTRHYGTGKTYAEVEPELRQDYERHYGSSGLSWEKAKYSIRDAWHRLENKVQNR
jgi:uncharacterized protein YcfJ